MANELEQASATPISMPVNSDDPPVGLAGFEIVHWLNKSLKTYKEHPPKILVDAVVQSTGMIYEEAEKQVPFDDIVDYILKQLEFGYSEYADYLDKTRIPDGAVLRQILNQQQ